MIDLTMQRLILIFITLLGYSIAAYGKPLEVPVISDHLTIKDGLSNNFVTDIIQDKRGFIWIGTESGLNRFDGENFTTFSMKNSAIAGNAVQCLLYDQKHDKIWIGTKKGLSVLDCTTLIFETIDFPDGVKTNNIVDLELSEDGGIWIVNHYDNIIYYNPDTSNITIYNPQNCKGLSGRYRSVLEGPGDIIYVGHANDGLSLIDKKKGKIRNYRHDPDNRNSLPGNDVYCIFIDHYGNVWVGTDKGLAMFDPVKEQFITFPHDPNNPFSPIGNHIYEILEMGDSSLWVASDMGGMSILDMRNLTFKNPGQLQFVNLEAVYGDVKSLSSPNIRALLQDSFGNIWIGNYSSGLDFISRSTPVFSIFPDSVEYSEEGGSKPIWSLYEDNEGIVWMGGINNVVSVKDGKILRVYDLSRFISSALSHVTAIKEYRGKLVLGIYDGGVLSLDIKSGVINRLASASLSHVNSLCETPDGRLIIGERDGIYVYDGVDCMKLDDISEIIFNLTPNGIVFDDQGKLWIGTYGLGIYIFDKDMKLVTRLDSAKGFVSNAILQLFKDSKGGIWIAGQDGLGYVEDTTRPENYVNYGYESGLDDVHIRAVAEDKNGDIWIALNNGLARLSRKSGKFDNYDYNYGIPQSSFLERSVILMDNGNLCFGTFNGICVFNPDSLSGSDKVASVQIVESQNIVSDTKNTTDGIIIPNSDGKIVLPYNHNSVRVMFAVSDFSQSHLVEYSYMIENIDKDWITTNGENYAIFRNLPPGKYVFRIRAKLKNQGWEDAAMSSMEIIVTPPFWLTWWAKFVYFVVVAVCIYLFVKYYKRRLDIKNSLELERKKSLDEKALNDERLRFYTNITHELRTPLTLILGPLEDLVSDDKMPLNYKNRVKIIHDSTLRLLNLINQILEFRKTETQNRTLTVGKGNIGNLVMEIGLRYKELNRNEKVAFEINVDKVSEDIYFDNEVITTVLNNLLSNAVKYTPAGKISLSLKEISEEEINYVEICVTDTGYGIDADALPHIFDRYYQVKGKHQASGTGIGLALVKSLSELHEAVLTVDSHPGMGTTFRLLLQKDNPYPKALHKEYEEDNKSVEAVNATGVDVKTDDKPLVLVVEDNEAIREYIKSSLDNKFRVIAAPDGKEGLDLAQQNIPDIIISDIMMPIMDGIELCKHVKENILTSHIPVILLTAKDSIRDKEEGYDSGADSYLTKPFSAKLLISRINNILESRKTLAALIASRIEKNRGESIGKVGASSDSESDTPLRLNKLDEEFLNRFTTLVEENMANVDMDMAFIHESFNMSHSTFYRKIKGLTGLSGNEFIRKIKLKHGYQLLKDGYNVTEAAYACGFGDVKHFRNSFKEIYGMTPSQFIKDLKLKG